MKISQLIKLLNNMQKKHGDIDVCLACQEWDTYNLLSENEIDVNSNVYAYDDSQEIAPGYEEGKTAVIIGSL